MNRKEHDPRIMSPAEKLERAMKRDQARIKELEAENSRLREALVTTTRSLSTCEQSYRIGGGREYADKLRAVLRDAWAVLRDTEAEAGQ